MIVNIPSKEDFENVAIENLTQAFTLLYKVYENEINLNDSFIPDEAPIEEIWEHHHGTIRTSLILLHQAIEGLMKAVICETSPLLLIDKPRRDWPSLPASENKDFDSLYTIGGESLLATFCATSRDILIDGHLIAFIEEIRYKRNQGIHGIDIKNINPKYIIQSYLRVVHYWFGKNAWFNQLKENLIDHPMFGAYDSDYEMANSYRFLDFALFIVGKKFLTNHLEISILGRSYFCPKCKFEVEKVDSEYQSKWAYLNPNKPTSNILTCVNCEHTFTVIRNDCNNEECKGNVLFDDEEFTGGIVCLTCYEDQDEE